MIRVLILAMVILIGTHGCSTTVGPDGTEKKSVDWKKVLTYSTLGLNVLIEELFSSDDQGGSGHGVEHPTSSEAS